MGNVEEKKPVLQWTWRTAELSQIVRVLDRTSVAKCQNQPHPVTLALIISMELAWHGSEVVCSQGIDVAKGSSPL